MPGGRRMISVLTQFPARVGSSKGNMMDARMIRVCRQSDLLRHAEILECWAKARERAIAALECEAERLAHRGSADQGARLRGAAEHLRQAVTDERLQASSLQKAAAIQ